MSPHTVLSVVVKKGKWFAPSNKKSVFVPLTLFSVFVEIVYSVSTVKRERKEREVW